MPPDSASTVMLDQQLLQAARLWVVHSRPYYASVLFRCPIVTSSRVATLAVDRHWRIYVNPSYANALSIERLATALIHEINHVIRAHDQRSSSAGVSSRSDQVRWNLAGDAELNDDLREDGLDVDLEHWAFPWTFGLPTDRTAEEYYPAITLDQSSAFMGEDERIECGSGSGGIPSECELGAEDESVPAVSTVEGRILRRRLAEEVISFAGRGDVPSGLLEWAHHELTPKVDWRRELQTVVRSALYGAGQADYSYRRFSRRDGAGHDVRWPGMERPTPQVAVVVDTSGSMSDLAIDQCLTEITAILRSASVAEDCVRVITCDVAVADDVVVSSVSRIRRMGRGGTDMRVGMAQAASSRPIPDVMIVLTDGETPWPDRALRGIRCVVGLVGEEAAGPETVPRWAHTVAIPI
jgi:predicted metal-dependent peptidase